MLKDKYQSLLDLGVELNVQNGDWKEEGGKLRITGTAAYQYDKDRLWDKIKSYENWENEVEADIAVANGDLYGLYVVKPGDTLSKLSKAHYSSRSYSILSSSPFINSCLCQKRSPALRLAWGLARRVASGCSCRCWPSALPQQPEGYRWGMVLRGWEQRPP